MLRSVFALALLATLLGGSVATMAASRHVSMLPAAVPTEAIPDRIADLLTVWW